MPLIYVSDADLQRLTQLVANEVTIHQSHADHAKSVGRYWRDIPSENPFFKQQFMWSAADNFKLAKKYTNRQNNWSALQRNLKNPKRSVDIFWSGRFEQLPRG